MEELYRIIEEKILKSGYPVPVDGKTFYEEVSDEVEQKENGTYLFTIKKSETVTYEGCMTVFDQEFDLHYVDIMDGNQTFHVDFDE